MLRSAGKRLAIITLLCDILKGVVSVLLAMLLGYFWREQADPILMRYMAGFFAIVGHTFPIFFGFKGGKGVATAIGAMLLLNWQIALTCLVFGIIMIAVTKMVSVGSIVSSILYPLLTIFMVDDISFSSVLVSIFIGLFVIFNHRENINRLKNGTENKLGQKV